MSFLQMSVSAGVLVTAIVLIRAVALHRLPKKMFLVLWGVALFRLLIPVSIPLPFSVPSVLISIGEVTRTVLPGNPAPPVGDNSINAGDNSTGFFGNGFTGDIVTGVPNDPATWITESPGTAGQVTEAAQGLIPNIAPPTAIWLAGMLVAFTFFTVIHYRNQRRLRFATAIRDNDFLNEWLARHRHIRPIAIMQSDRIISPLAVGIFKPRIILPKSMNMSDTQLLDYVLTHEYYHIKRFDAVWKMVLLLALCVHWFNPMMWVMFVLASRDLELTCDEAVMRRFGAKTRKDYAYMLIGMVEQGSKFAPLYNGFSKNATQERIESIMKTKKTHLLAVILAVVLVSVLTVGVLAATAANNDNTTPPANSADNGFKELTRNSEQYKNQNPDDENQPEIHTPYSEDDIKGELEIIGEDKTYRFGADRFEITATDVKPGMYASSAEAYAVTSGDVVVVAASWFRSGLDIQIGFVSKSDNSVQYWGEVRSGGVITRNGSTVSIEIKDIPDGEYYVCIKAPSTNATNLDMVIAHFEWVR